MEKAAYVSSNGPHAKTLLHPRTGSTPTKIRYRNLPRQNNFSHFALQGNQSQPALMSTSACCCLKRTCACPADGTVTARRNSLRLLLLALLITPTLAQDADNQRIKQTMYLCAVMFVCCAFGDFYKSSRFFFHQTRVSNTSWRLGAGFRPHFF